MKGYLCNTNCGRLQHLPHSNLLGAAEGSYMQGCQVLIVWMYLQTIVTKMICVRVLNAKQCRILVVLHLSRKRPSSLCAHACTASQGAFKLLRRPHDTLCKYV